MSKVQKYKKYCPQCGNEQIYSYKESFYLAKKTNSICKPCSIKNSWDIRGRTKGTWTRICTECKEIKFYGRKWDRDQAILKKVTCKSCCQKGDRNISKRLSVKRKQRISAAKRVTPNYNPQGCKIIDWFNMYYEFNFQHAENGGEICIDGYFPDGVDQKQMVIIEIDEKHHFNNGNLKQKDIIRQQYLENLGYNFMRIKQ